MDAIQTLSSLRWTQAPHIRPLPTHIERRLVRTTFGDLELLVSEPKIQQSTRPAIFFLHGGYGSAGVWLEWMSFLREHNYAGWLYAYSARNHGASFTVPYAKMVFGTPISAIASDLITCVKVAEQENDGDRVILVGHSSGGGLAQYCLSRGDIIARALCLVDAVPHFGMLDMYWNWLKHDPWFPLRSLVHLGHPTSPLSTPDLVQGAFFGTKYESSSAVEFMRWMPCYESMNWPIAMFGSFANWLRGKNSWLETPAILQNVECSRSAAVRDHVCVVFGLEDIMFDQRVTTRVARDYREALAELDRFPRNARIDSMHAGTDCDGISTESRGGVRVVLLMESGHHVQNDMQTEVAAEALLTWLNQV